MSPLEWCEEYEIGENCGSAVSAKGKQTSTATLALRPQVRDHPRSLRVNLCVHTMGAILRMGHAFLAIRKLALFVVKRPSLKKALCALLRRFMALWSKFWLAWTNWTSSRKAKGSPVGPRCFEIQEAPAQTAPVKKTNYDDSLSFGDGQLIPIRRHTPQWIAHKESEIINLENVACSLYPLSQGSHGNSWTTLSQNLGPSSSANDVVNFTNEPLSFLHEHTITQSYRSSTHSDSSIQGGSPTEMSRTLHSPCYLRHSRIKPIMPEDFDRYDAEKRRYSPGTNFDTTIELTIAPIVRPIPSQGWVEYVHPEGGRYFFHKEKRVYTDANIYDQKILEQVMDDISIITDFVYKNAIALPEGSDLIIDIVNDTQTNYYFANHDTRSIFFIDTYETNDTSIDSPGRLRHHIEVQYWFHVNLYPHSLALSASLAGELKDIVLHFVGDSMTSPSSTAPYDLNGLYKILDITTNLESHVNNNALGSMTFISRFMYIFASSKYWNYAGEAHARLDREQSMNGSITEQRSWLMKTMSVLLFSIPTAHLRKLQRLWVDQIVYAFCWDQMFKQLSSEWKAQILLAAILLNANIGFLTVRSEDVHRNFLTSPAQICSYMSMATNIGSILMGLLLVTQTSKERPVSSGQAVQNYLNKRVHPSMGLEILAILYSLPYGFLLWSLLYFLAAFFFNCFQNTDSSARIVVGSLCAPIILTSWWAYTSWGKLLQKSHEHINLETQSSSPSNKIIGIRWIMPANRWIGQTFSRLCHKSHDAEKPFNV